jgi:hypothetical protein
MPDLPAEAPIEPVPEPTLETAPEPVPPAPEPVAETGPTPLELLVVDEIRMAIRGRTVAELADLLQETEDSLQPAVERLVARGELLWRGRKLYLP